MKVQTEFPESTEMGDGRLSRLKWDFLRVGDYHILACELYSKLGCHNQLERGYLKIHKLSYHFILSLKFS